MMDGHGKSDSLIVPRKSPNKAPDAEEVEGRRLAKGSLKARPPPKPKASLVTMHFDYSDSQISFAGSFYADPDYPIDSYLS